MEKWIAKRKTRFVELGIEFYITNDWEDQYGNKIRIDESNSFDELEKERKDYDNAEYKRGRSYINKILYSGNSAILLHGVGRVLPGGYIEGSKSDRAKLFDRLHDFMTLVCGWPRRK